MSTNISDASISRVCSFDQQQVDRSTSPPACARLIYVALQVAPGASCGYERASVSEVSLLVGMLFVCSVGRISAKCSIKCIFATTVRKVSCVFFEGMNWFLVRGWLEGSFATVVYLVNMTFLNDVKVRRLGILRVSVLTIVFDIMAGLGILDGFQMILWTHRWIARLIALLRCVIARLLLACNLPTRVHGQQVGFNSCGRENFGKFSSDA